MVKTIPHPYANKQFIGYVLNSPLSKENQKVVYDLQQAIRSEFGNVIYLPTPESLHITLMDWLAPLVDYGQDKDDLFDQLFHDYDQALKESIQGVGPIKVHFSDINVFPESIIIKGTDQGQYQAIRNRFVSRVKLLPNTKQPPRIVHSSAARFLKETDLNPIEDFISARSISITEVIGHFRLLRVTDTKMEVCKLIKDYSLK